MQLPILNKSYLIPFANIYFYIAIGCESVFYSIFVSLKI